LRALSLLPQVPPADLQLVLQGAAAGGRNLTFRSSNGSSNGSSNCSSWDFAVLPNATAQPGSYAAHLVLPKQRGSLRLPRNITVDVPLLLSMRAQTVNASADTSAFAVRVQLNAPAGPAGVTVRLQLMNDAGAVKVSLQEHGRWVQDLQQQQQQCLAGIPLRSLLASAVHVDVCRVYNNTATALVICKLVQCQLRVA
jgi:hypothetical protein